MVDKPLTIAETKVFERAAASCMTNDELEEFKYFIAQHPEKGRVIRGTGGVRKVRWGVAGSGKSGGVRVGYYYIDRDCPLYLLTVYSKSEKDSLTDSEKATLKQLTKLLKDACKN